MIEIPGYTSLEEIDQGGFGTVYKAKDSNGGLVVIKIPNHEGIEFFRQETEILKELQHPRIISYRESSNSGNPYLVMDYAEFGCLADNENFHKKFDYKEPVRVTGGVLEALSYAHSKGVIHGDVTPRNISFDENDEVKVSGFRLSKDQRKEDLSQIVQSIVTTAQIAGTCDYMSPEQKKGIIDSRNDIYSVGVVLYEMLTGELPTCLRKPSEINDKIPKDIDTIVAKALDSIDNRYQTADEFKEDLERTIEPKNQMSSVEFITGMGGFLGLSYSFFGFSTFGLIVGISGVVAGLLARPEIFGIGGRSYPGNDIISLPK